MERLSPSGSPRAGQPPGAAGGVSDSQAHQQQQQQPDGHSFSPLTASLHGQRSRGSLGGGGGGGGSPRGSREGLLLTPGEEQRQQQKQQQHNQQQESPPWLQQHQHEQMEQLQQGHAAAFVSLLPAPGGGSGSGSMQQTHAPRSPSRLRYIRKDSSSAAGTGSLQASAPQAKLPEFLQVQELPPGILREDEVEIVHQEGDEAVRAADVEDKIIRQVDELVAYFNGLFEDDQVDISMLQQELASRDMELSRRNMLIQQLMTAKQQHHAAQASSTQPYVDPGIWAAVKRSWRRSPCCWMFVALLLVALVLVIALPAALVRPPGPAPPVFAFQPQLVTATASELDFVAATSTAAVLHYVLLPRSAGGSAASLWTGSFTAADVAAASAGLGSGPLEWMHIAACGSLATAGAAAAANTTFTVAGVSSPECVAATAAGRRSCARCPVLDAGTSYDVLLVAAGLGGALGGRPVQLQAATLPGASSRAPRLRATSVAPTPPRAAVAAATEASFDLSFELSAPGMVGFLVLYAQMYARFVDTYVVFDNTVSDPSAMLSGARDAFQDGLVARGRISVGQAGGGSFRCTIGGPAAPAGGACSCSPPVAACSQEAACFGALCDYSRLALAPSTSYRVVLVPLSADGREQGPATPLAPFSMGAELSPPQLSPRLAISLVVGPDRFSVANISQDKPGFAYLLVTRPANQVNSKVAPGTATPFAQVPGAARSRGGRQLLLAPPAGGSASSSLSVLPAEAGAARGGDAFLPPCQTALPCEQYLGSARDYTSPGSEALVFSKCVALARISETASALVTALANNTLYRVAIVPTDRNNNQDAWSAFVRTQDLSPPVLTVLDAPPPDFDAFGMTASLDEPGTVFATLLLASSAATTTASAACPPQFVGPMVGAATLEVAAGSTPFNISFGGLAANTDYLLRLIAVDATGNCQPAFTNLPVHTLDNIPPVTLAFEVFDVGGTTAGLQLTLDEPGAGFFAVLPRSNTTCPAPPDLFLLQAEGGTALPLGAVAAGNLTVAAGAVPALHTVGGLASETDYTACVVAADATRLRNQQAAGTSSDFRTLDITPPLLDVAALPGTDGNFSCDRTSFMCTLAFASMLDEPGSISWVLVPDANLPPQLPGPAQLAGAVAGGNLTDLLAGVGGNASTGSIAVAAAGVPANTTVPGLPSETAFTLLLAARDAATPTANYAPQLRQLALVAPDFRPPAFTEVVLSAVGDTALTVSAALDEPGTTYCLAVPSPSAAPTPVQVAAGQGAATTNGSAATAAVSAAASVPMPQRNVSAACDLSGLTPNSWYDIYLVARDDAPAGNLQMTVTNITRVRTTDSVPPAITGLTATFTPPMSLQLTFTVSKAGALWLAPRRAGQLAPTAQEVVDAVAARSTAQANFTAVLDVPSAGAAVSTTLCVADGDQLVVHAAARDSEGQWPGREDNVSPLASVPVVLAATLDADASCPSLAFLQPDAAFAAALADGGGLPLPGLSLLGTMLGPRTINGTTGGVTRMQQDILAFSSGSRSPAQLLSSVGAASAASGAIRLPGAMQLTVQPAPPASIVIILRSAVLVPDANADDGATLRLSYQLRDAAGRTRVDASGLSLRPLLSYEAGAALPSTAQDSAGVQAAGSALQECSLDHHLGGVSGVGECSVVVPRKFFPSAGGGSLAAKVALRVLVRGTQVAAAEASGLQLQAPPVLPAFAPSSQPGLLITLPFRAVHFGEVVRVTLAAVQPLMQGLTGFTLPLRYDKSVLEFQGARSAGALWQPLSVATASDAGGFGVAVLSAGRAPRQSDAAYRADMTGIGLADVYFVVRASRGGTAAGVLSLLTAPSAAGAAAASLWPAWPAPFAQFNSFNGASSSAGALSVEALASLGMFAWAGASDLVNTAPLTGQPASVALRGVLVTNWGSSSSGSGDAAAGDALTGCAIAAGGAARAAASAALDPLRRLCAVTASASNSVPAKGLAVTLSIQQGVLAAQSAQVSLDVWAPTSLALTADDTTLNSVLPINAAPASPSCAAFQATALRLSATWSNGGSQAGDSLAGADVTALASFASNDTSVAQVSGSMVKGFAPGTAAITTPAAPDVRLVVSVSREPACLVQLHTVATTGVAALAGALPGTAAAVSMPPNRRTPLSWWPVQQLDWEDSRALVLSYARFSDGAVLDVTDKAAVVAAAAGGAISGAAGGLPPFSLRTDNATGLSWLTVNITVGASAPCQPYLSSSWAVCSNSVQLGAGAGSVRVSLPQPLAVANLSASPAAITRADDPARLSPMLLTTSAGLSLAVAFDDGSVRDFSADPRLAFAMAPGSTLCQVVPAAAGGWSVVAAPSAGSVSGACVVSATVAFGSGLPPLTATVSVELVGLSRLVLYAAPADAVVPPDPSSPGSAAAVALDAELVLLKCDALSYDQRTLWAFGVLSNCTANTSCPLIDLNSRQFTALNSSDAGVAAIAPSGYPLLDNTLAPLAAGASSISAAFAQGAARRAFTLTARNTYAPGWPAASPLTDTSARLGANMSEPGLAVSYLLVPSAQLDLRAQPPVMPSLAAVQAGVSLVADPAQGPNHLTATAGGLLPGTNYTLLAAVASAGGAAPGASPTVTALSGLLVPDTAPPSFTRAAALGAAPNAGGASSDGTFSVRLELGLDEDGRVAYAVYGDPACITADPSPAEILAGVNLANVGKCACAARFCAAAAFGSAPVSASNASTLLTLRASLPPFPFDNLGADASCSTYTPSGFSSTKHAVFLVAEDTLPTFKGWTSRCAMPAALPTPPAAGAPPPACPLVHVAACTNTPPPAETVNRQAPPFAAVDLATAATASASVSALLPPPRAPIRGVVQLVDPIVPDFVAPALASSGAGAVVWTFGTSKPGLVQWRLVEQVTRVIASGLLAVVDAAQRPSVAISRTCAGAQLVPGTSYALWFNMTDVYGTATDVSILKVTLT